MNCKNHPKTSTNKKCYQCKEPICQLCQVRGSHHVFCSDECHEKYLAAESGALQKISAIEGEKLIPGTPHVDSAYSEERIPPGSGDSSNLIAIQAVIDKTDKELKSCLKDLEIIFDSSNKENLKTLQEFFEIRWAELNNGLNDFRRSAEKSTAELKTYQQNIAKKQEESSQGLDLVTRKFAEELKVFESSIKSNQAEAGKGISEKFYTIKTSLDSIASSVDSKIERLKSFLTEQTARFSGEIAEKGKVFSSEVAQGLSSLGERFDSKFGDIRSLIDTGRETEKELFKRNEESVKSLLEAEKKYFDGLLEDYQKKFSTNLTSNRERFSQAVTQSNSEIKDFLSFERTELLKSVGKLGENLESILKNADKNLSSSGTEISKRLEQNLKENTNLTGKNLEHFGGNLKDLLENHKRSIEDYLSAVEEEQQEVLKKFSEDLGSSVSSQKQDFDKSLSAQALLVNNLLDTSQKSFDNALKNQNYNFSRSLEGNAGEIRTNLDSLNAEFKSRLTETTTNMSKTMETLYSGVKENLSTTQNRVEGFIEDQKTKLLKHIGDSFAGEKEELARLLSSTQKELAIALESTAKGVASSNIQNREAIESTIKSKVSEIDAIINNQVKEMQTRLDKTAFELGQNQRETISSSLTSLYKAFNDFESNIKGHLEKRERILLDEMACLVVSNKGNMQEILLKSRADIEAQIRNVERSSERLLKTEIKQSMDVFNLNLSSLLGEIKDNLIKKVRAIPTQFSLSWPIKTAIIALLALAVLNPVFFFVSSLKTNKYMSENLDRLAYRIPENGIAPPAKTSKESKAIASEMEKPIISIADGYQTSRESINLKGTAKTGDFALLSNNGTWLGIKFIKNRAFLFEDIKLNPGENRIEVTAYTSDGKKSATDTRQIFYLKTSSKIYNLAYNVTRGDLRRPLLSLTFDGGSNAIAAPMILQTLKDKGITTTMFLTGDFIRKNPELVKKMVDEGHEVGNHSYSHPHFIKDYGTKYQKTAVSKKDFQKELLKTRQIFKDTTGKDMAPYWRAPYGEINDDLLTWAKELGFTHIRWTIHNGKTMDSLDWVEMEESHLYRSADDIKKVILGFDEGVKGGSNGGIIIMHLGTNRESDQPYSKLGEIVDGMRAKGYDFIKVSDLLKTYGQKRVATK